MQRDALTAEVTKLTARVKRIGDCLVRTIAERDLQLAGKDERIAELEQQIVALLKTIASQSSHLAAMQARIEALSSSDGGRP